MNGESPLPPKPDKDNTEKREDQSKYASLNFGIKIISKNINKIEQSSMEEKNITDQVEFIPGSETGSPFRDQPVSHMMWSYQVMPEAFDRSQQPVIPKNRQCSSRRGELFLNLM